jgi:hypothetical protein
VPAHYRSLPHHRAYRENAGALHEEDGGSTPPAPTTPPMSRAFAGLSVQLWMGRAREDGSAVGRALNCLPEGVLLKAGQLAPRSRSGSRRASASSHQARAAWGEVTITGHSRFASACRKIPSSTPRLLRPAHPRRRCPPWYRSRTRCSCRRQWARRARAWWRRRHRDQPNTPAGSDGLVHRDAEMPGSPGCRQSLPAADWRPGPTPIDATLQDTRTREGGRGHGERVVGLAGGS